MTQRELQIRRRKYPWKTHYHGERTLIVLPCNAGGPLGNYYHYRWSLWRQVSYYTREWCSDTILMAIDNAVCWMPGRDDGLGAAEMEFEMSRCISPDDYGVPYADRFDADKMKLFVDSLCVTCERIKEYGFTRVFAIVTPLAYRTAFLAATTRTNLSVAVFKVARCGMANVAAQMLRCLLLLDSPVEESELLTHPIFDKGKFPQPRVEWKVPNVLLTLPVVDLGDLIVQVKGKRATYYVLSCELEGCGGFSDQDWNAFYRRYLVSDKESSDVFR